jgi:hypothetical protein
MEKEQSLAVEPQPAQVEIACRIGDDLKQQYLAFSAGSHRQPRNMLVAVNRKDIAASRC